MALDIPGLPSVDFDLAVLANGMLRLFNEEPKDVILHMLSEGYGRVQDFLVSRQAEVGSKQVNINSMKR